MERRLVIKQVLIMAGGMLLLPSCLRQEGKSTIALKNIKVSLDQENLLAEIAAAIIPKTDTPGAKELKLQLFVLKMLDDCYEEKVQQQFLRGLDQLEQLAHSRFSKTYVKLPVAQKQELLLAAGAGQDPSADLVVFYTIMKEWTIDGYLNSQYVMTNLVIWELVPGRYNGYFPVKSA
jgi:hypothetical protein